MQQGRHQRLAVKFPFCALQGHCNRVGDIRFPTAPCHAQMRFVGKFVGAPDLLDPLCAQIVQLRDQRGKAGRRRIAGGRWKSGSGCDGSHGLTVAFCLTQGFRGEKKALLGQCFMCF